MAAQYPPAGYPSAGYYPPPPAPPAKSNPARTVVVFVLVLVGSLLTAVTPVIIWSRDEVLNTNAFVNTMAPAGRDPGVQAAVISEVDNQIDAALNKSGLLGAVGGTAVVDGLVNTAVTSFVHSSAFPPLWDQLTRTAHDQLVLALTGKSDENSAVEVDDQGKVMLNLGPVVDQIKQDLVDNGLSIANSIPSVNASFQIAQLDSFQQAQTIVRWLDPAATWLPWITLLIFALAVLIAHRRRRTVLAIGISVAVGMVLVAVVVFAGRTSSINEIPTSVMPHATAAYLYDIVIRTLVIYLAVVFVAAVALVIGALLAGPSRVALGRATRSRTGSQVRPSAEF